MLRRCVALAGLASFTLALAACGGGNHFADASPDALDAAGDVPGDLGATNDAPGLDAPTADAPGDAPRDVGIDVAPLACNPSPDDAGLAAGTYTYVISSLTIDDTATNDTPHTGFNLDGLFSGATDATGCNHQDFFSRFDPDQDSPSGCVMGTPGCAGGVDNQLPALADSVDTIVTGFSTRIELETDVDQSLIVYLVQLLDVDDLTNDPAVRVRIFAGYPTFTTGCDTVAADREYQVTRGSLAPGGTTLDDAAFVATGQIVDGRLEVSVPMDSATVLPITLPAFIGGTNPTIALHGVHLRANITATSATSGNLGGAALGADLVSTFQAAAPMYRAVIDPIVGQNVDIQVAGVCEEISRAPHRFGEVGFGLGVQMVRATIRAGCPVTDAPTPGVCGTL